MTPQRLQEITARYPALKIAVAGDLCLDRYFEIDPERRETSIETNLPVHNVTRVRCQPGAAGTIINNLAALGAGRILPAAIVGDDGEAFELKRALKRIPAVALDHLVQSASRHTFTYSKPLLMHRGKAPEELSRLDTKNWSPTPPELQEQIVNSLRQLAQDADALILLDQVDIAETGVITSRVLEAVREIAEKNPKLLVLADSRRSLRDYPAVSLKMNRAELELLRGTDLPSVDLKDEVLTLARRHGHYVFVTLSEKGIVGAHARGEAFHVPSLPVRGEIDIVGAGDAVTANLACALAAGASLQEAMELAQLASSRVIHQLGTTGAASVKDLLELLMTSPFMEA